MTIQTAMAEIQKRVYERLSSDPILSAKITGVFNSVEEDQGFPYLTVGEPSVLPFITKSKFGEELSIMIHAWSLYNGNLEAINLLNLCLDALSARMQLDGFIIRKVDIDQIRVIDDADSRIKHGILRMKYTIQNN